MKLLLLLSLLVPNSVFGYLVGPPSSGTHTRSHNNNRLRSFEAQELRFQLDAMNDARIRVSDIDKHRRQELVSFADKLISYQSPVDTKDVPNHLVNTKWRLAFTSDDHVLKTWHHHARSIHLEFQEKSLVHYIVSMGKKFLPIQHRLRWESDASSGRVVFSAADSIKDRMETMHDAAIDRMGFLKTCKPGIETVYFDGDIWIERSLGSTGEPFSNIYLREPLEKA
uniref:Plastid lipid-associated protein/fibrillin conserved domain-containing protein n=1 Tax=Amphora coffeiformis TaxID=265554 RepID=A0A7S3PCJ1_9STRA|mmetsp:Transcript_1706/g.3253  ORF Transcript_1706/g.3253 Transcript_1706/m.3253 type:complete len:225 (+) Transcript_1706:114-788(+)|eukprot:scaffold353_cov185-Amphora_coffeaeformis.AAC.64